MGGLRLVLCANSRNVFCDVSFCKLLCDALWLSVMLDDNTDWISCEGDVLSRGEFGSTACSPSDACGVPAVSMTGGRLSDAEPA